MITSKNTYKIDDIEIEIYRDYSRDKGTGSQEGRLEGSMQMCSPWHAAQCHSFFRYVDSEDIALSVGLSNWIGNHLIARHGYQVDDDNFGRFFDTVEYEEFQRRKEEMIKSIKAIIHDCRRVAI
jgi:N-acetyl-anhydromuramyl-L-alanine amidase AmpD